jgi:hypothetical protein
VSEEFASVHSLPGSDRAGAVDGHPDSPSFYIPRRNGPLRARSVYRIVRASSAATMPQSRRQSQGESRTAELSADRRMPRRSGDAIHRVIALRLTSPRAAWHVLAAPQQRRVEPGRVAYGHCRYDPSRTGGGSSSCCPRSRRPIATCAETMKVIPQLDHNLFVG